MDCSRVSEVKHITVVLNILESTSYDSNSKGSYKRAALGPTARRKKHNYNLNTEPEEGPQRYCSEIQRKLMFLTNLYCRKFIIRPNLSISIAEHYRKNTKTNVFTGTQTQNSFRFYNPSSCNFPERESSLIGSTLLSCLVT
jgi:hypothetical protein